MPEIISQFHFLRPAWFFVFIPTALLLAALWRQHFRQSGLEGICDADLLPHLLLDQGRSSRKRPLALLAAAWLLAVTALAGPVWKQQPQTTYRLGSGRVLVLDLSPSMAATDITPSRLERARYKLNDILQQSREGRTGLVVFSGDPHVVVPLTDDVATISSLLPALSVDVMPSYGDAAEKALELAAALLSREGIKGGDILLITDGVEDMASSVSRAANLRKSGIRLSVLGIGTERGAPVPDPTGGGFVSDGAGSPRLSRLDSASMQEIATAGGGRYSLFTADEQDIHFLLGAETKNLLSAGKNTNKNIDRWQEEGVWLVLPLLLLALAGFRRGWLVAAVFILLLHPGFASAMTWQDLWQRPDQQAAELLAEGDAKKAAERFNDPAWRAFAQHMAGDYKAAIETGKNASGAVDLYNLGNSLARAGELEKALAAYDKALQMNPSDEDAGYNQELIKKLMEQQKKEEQQTRSGDSSDQQKQDDKQQEGQKKEQNNDQQSGQSHQEEEKKEGDKPRGQNGAEARKNEQQQEQEQKTGRKDQQQMDREKQPDQEKENTADQQSPEKPQPQDQINMNQENKEAAQREKQKANPAFSVPDDRKDKMTDEELVLEQWLRQVPDDPSGLLRRKFMLEHQRRLQQGE
ncbi:MAG: VWA domain-containing protein [Pseudomonadota bacterium]